MEKRGVIAVDIEVIYPLFQVLGQVVGVVGLEGFRCRGYHRRGVVKDAEVDEAIEKPGVYDRPEKCAKFGRICQHLHSARTQRRTRKNRW